uniref:PqiC family protein n=1 Tax=Castellaniella defragrans TaxID=75697 RepID=UPI00334275A2
MRLIVSLGIAALLSACAVTPGTYYSLSAPPPAGQGGAGPATAGGVRFLRVRVPAEVERPQLVVRRESSDTQVVLLNESLWAAPLGDQIQAALAVRVSRTLGVPDLSQMVVPEGKPVREVTVQVSRFEMVFGQYASLEANWSEGTRPGPDTRLCQAALRVPVAGPGIAALVEGQRTAVGLLADIIAARMSPAVAMPDDPAIQRNSCT